MRKIHWILSLLVGWLCTCSVYGQGIVSFTSDEGLSNTCVHTITEDSYHNVWVSTRNGLNLFDGAKLRTFFHDEADSLSLIDNMVTCVSELVPGKILVGTNAGLCLYDYSTDHFTPIPLIDQDQHNVRPRIIDASKRKDGSVLVLVVGRTGYIVSYDGKSVKAQYTLDYVLNDRGAVHFTEARDGTQWLLSSSHEVAYIRDGKMHQVALPGSASHLIEGVKGQIYIDIEGEGLYQFDERTKSFKSLSFPELSNVVIKNLRSNGEGCIFVCTDGNGLYLYNERTGELDPSHVRTTEYSITTANVEDAMQDKAGNLWIGIYWKGIVVYPHTASAFEYVGRRSGLKNTIGTNCVTAVHPAEDGWMWVGTDHCGLYHLSPDGSESVHFKPGVVPNVPETITAIYMDKSGVLWLGSSIGGMVCMNTKTGVFTPFDQIEPDGKDVRKVYGIQSDKYGNIWIATMGNGLFCYNPQTHKLDHYSSMIQGREDGKNLLINVWINSLAVDGNFIYMGHSSGLDRFRIKDNGELECIGHYLHGSVNDVKVDDKGVVWCATGSGLYSLNFYDNNDEVKRLTKADGLSNNMARSIQLNYLPNGECEVWVSTDNGLNCYSPSSNSFRRFYIGDGLQGNEFTEHCSTRVGDYLVFGGINGLNYFNPADVIRTQDESALQLRIVGLYLQGELVRAGQQSGKYTIYDSWIDRTEEINLCHTDNSLAIELDATVLSQFADFEYSLDGKKWQNLGKWQNRIVLNNLRPGTYLLHIRALANGKMSEERVLRVVIHAPWYTSLWMKIIYCLLILSTIYLIYTYVRTRTREKKFMLDRQQQDELAEARIQFFMNISHEIRTPMTLILAPLEKLRSMNDDEEHHKNYNLIYQNAQRILQLINQMMDVRKIEKGQFVLDYQHVEIVSFISNLFELFKTTALQRGIEMQYIHSVEKLDVEVDSASLDKVLMNLLSNAMKFTSNDGHVDIQLSVDETADTFTISVTDDGVGISGKNKEKVFERFYSGVHQNGYVGTGIGLNLTYLLVQLHKGDIKVMDNPKGRGTCFEVTLPCHRPEQVVSAQQMESSPLSPVADKIETKRHRNLLLVEDDMHIRQYLREELSPDFIITECINGQEAWDHVVRYPERVDMIITDIMMPLMGGDELCQKVKANFNTSHIPVIILSAKNTDADRIAGMSIGADAYMTKPFNVNLLRTTAITILQNHQSLQRRAITDHRVEEKIEDVKVTSPDEQLMDRIMRCVNENMSNPELSVEFVADAVGVSRVHFHRKLKELTGQTPRDFIRNIRLQQAARLLREKRIDITDVSVATGFRSLSTFSTTFKAMFGMTPTEYMNSKKDGNNGE